MKTITLFVGLVFASCLFSCTDSENQINPSEQQKLIVTNWNAVPWSAEASFIEKDSILHLYTKSRGNTTIDFPELTEAVLKSSNVYIYKRYFNITTNSKLQEAISQKVTLQSSLRAPVFTEGKAGVPYESVGLYEFRQSESFSPGILNFDAELFFYGSLSQWASSSKQKELAGLSTAELIKRLNDAMQYRVIVINKELLNTEYKNIDFNDYEVVKKALDIKD